MLALIVTIHEAGHYLSSKLFGVQVEEFSVGFGPKLASFTVWGDEFNLRALPLGGYVRFPENYNATLARETEEAELELAAEFLENQRRATDPSWGARILNAVTLGAVDDKLWADEKKRRQQQQQASGISSSTDSTKPQPLSTWWNKIFKRDRATKEATSQQVPGEIEYYDDPDLLQNRPWPQRAVVLSGGILFNLLLAFCIYFGQINLGPGLPVPVFDEGIVVTAVPRTDAAAHGILRQGDVIVAVDGMPVAKNFMSTTTGGAAARRSAVSASDSQKAIRDLIAQIRATPEGESLTLDVKHGATRAIRASANSALAASDSTSIQQQQQQQSLDRVRVQPKRVNNGDNAGPLTIGVLLSPNYAGTDIWKTSNPVEAAQLSLQYVTSVTQETASGLFSFFAGFVAGGGSGGGGGGAQVSGPIGLIRTGSEVVATRDWTAVLLFAAAISINLGVINAVPLPALDGGQLVFVLAEALTGRKVNQRFQEGVTGVAVLVPASV